MRESRGVTSPFLYYAGDRLTHAELMSARLDGDVVEVGEAYMPADAVETAEIRAGSLRDLGGENLAFTHESAAWVYGALDDPPKRHSLQRYAPTRPHHILDARIRYRDVRLPTADGRAMAGVVVSTPVRTVVDLLRDRVFRDGASPATVEALLRDDATLAAAALRWSAHAAPLPYKRAAVAFLREWELKTM